MVGGQDWPDIEGEVAWIYSVADADPHDPPHVFNLAESLFGENAVIYRGRVRIVGQAALTLRGRRQYQLFAADPRWQIVLSRCQLQREEPTLVGHEIFEWRAQRLGLRTPYIESWCNAGGRGLVMPGPCLSRVIHRAMCEVNRAEQRGERPPGCFRTIANYFDVTQVQAAIRYAEFSGLPMALVPPKGPPQLLGEPWNWGSIDFVRTLACAKWHPRAIRREWLSCNTVALWPTHDAWAEQVDLTSAMDRVLESGVVARKRPRKAS
jgi:hypothetical protein